MTSLSISRQKSEGKEQQCSVNTERIKSEITQLVHAYQYTTNIYTKSRKEQREMKFKHPESANCQNSNDVIDDGINRGGDVNRLVDRERYATTKHSFSHTKEFLKNHIKYMQTVPYPVGYHISSGYKPHRKWFKYELAKTRMYSWARCCGMPGMWNNEMRRHSSRDDNVCSKCFWQETHKCIYIPLRERLCFLD